MRLFVALDLPVAVRQALDELIARLKRQCRDARWVRTEGMHLTLKFIGWVDPAEPKRFDSLRASLATVRSDTPVEMRFRGVGFFPNARRPRVAWCGVEASPNLAEIVADIERALEPLGVPREQREFVPHLTLARFNSQKGLEPLLRAADELQSCDFGSARETEFYLYESVLKRSGAEYRKVETYSFVKGT
ncbi:MAG TPA: RNA 2',3'-cyclic phosphodiesterase [Candidatus Polarisedimenticolia bacterium]|nr:RNA 2',3'-cyclic phosphodiesterase [Candidatus Polarisedimenticolia bacterium]